jgi:hypothetical protein
MPKHRESPNVAINFSPFPYLATHTLTADIAALLP